VTLLVRWTGQVGQADGRVVTWTDVAAVPEVVPGVVLAAVEPAGLWEVVALEQVDLPEYAPTLRRAVLRRWGP